MDGLCSALSALWESLPEPPSRATDLAAALGINPQLAWQVFKMAATADALAAVQYLPTSNQLNRVIDAAETAGARAETVRPAREAAALLDDLIASHSKDRREFESLVGSLTSGRAQQVDLKHRRALHRGNAYFYGIQALASYGCVIEHPTPDNRAHHAVVIGGLIGLHTLRADVPMTLLHRVEVPDDGPSRTGPAMALGAIRVLKNYGAGDRLPLVPMGEENGATLSRMVFSGVGRGSAFSFMSAMEYQNQLPEDNRYDNTPGMGRHMNVPSESLVIDILVPAAWRTSGHATVTTFARRQQPDKVPELRSVDIIPTNDEAVCIRNITRLPAIAEVPGAPEVIRGVLVERGWDKTTFDLYRCRIAFPVLHSLVRIKVQCDDGPSERRGMIDPAP